MSETMFLGFCIMAAGGFVIMGLAMIASELGKIRRQVLHDEWHIKLYECRTQYNEDTHRLEESYWLPSLSAMIWHEPMGIDPKKPGSTYYDRFYT